MRRKRQLIHSQQENDFERLEEELSLVELNNDELSFIYNRINNAKRYVLKEHDGSMHVTSNLNELKDIFEKANIKEVLIEELSSGKGKRQSIKVDNSITHKKKVKRSKTLKLVGEDSREKNISLYSERILNSKSVEIEDNTNLLTLDNSVGIEEVERSVKPVKSVKNLEEKESVEVLPQKEEKSEDFLLHKRKVTKKDLSLNKNFFKIKNNSELFKVGKSYMDDLKAGRNCFGFTSNGNSEEISNTIFGISSFFNYYDHTEVLAFVSERELLALRKKAEFVNSKTFTDDVLDIKYDVWESSGLSLISYSSLRGEDRVKTYDLIDKLTAKYGVSICSIPGEAELESDIDLFFQVLQRVDNISLVLKKNNSKVKKVRNLVEKLRNYKVSIKGVLIAS